ncbi:hypothetical protein FF2_039465 [Malus domestica]
MTRQWSLVAPSLSSRTTAACFGILEGVLSARETASSMTGAAADPETIDGSTSGAVLGPITAGRSGRASGA